MVDYVENLGVPKKTPGKPGYCFSPSMARGLDYYTGPIFETTVTNPPIGSLTGGGRYDKLISSLGGPDIPGMGTTIGLDRICDVIGELNLLPEIKKSTSQALVTIFSPKQLEKSIEVATILRSSNIVNVELYPDPEAKLDKQLKYADRKGIPYVIIIGPDEIEKKTVTLKDMRKKTQKQILFDKLPKELDSC